MCDCLKAWFCSRHKKVGRRHTESRVVGLQLLGQDRDQAVTGASQGPSRGSCQKRPCPASTPGGASGKEPTCQHRRCKRCRFNPWVGKIPCMKKWQPTPIILSGKSHGQWSLVGYSPYSWKESDTTEHAPIFILNLATRHGMLDLCLLPRDQTSNPCIGRAEC